MFERLFGGIAGRNRLKQLHAAEELSRRLEEKASLVVDSRLIADLGVGRKVLYRVIYELVRRERMFMLADKNDQMLLMTNTEFNRFMLRRSGRQTPLPALTLSEARTPESAAGGTVFVETEQENDLPVVAEIAAQLAENRMLTADELFCDDADSSILLEEPAGEKVLDDYWEIPAAALDSSLASNLSPSIPEPLGGVSKPEVKPTRKPTRKVARNDMKDKELQDIETLAKSAAQQNLDWFSLDVAAADAERPDLPDYRQGLPARKREPWLTLEDAVLDWENSEKK